MLTPRSRSIASHQETAYRSGNFAAIVQPDRLKRLRLTAQMPAGHQQLNAFASSKALATFIPLVIAITSVCCASDEQSQKWWSRNRGSPDAWLNQLNGSFRNAAFHRGVQALLSSTDGSTDGVVLSQINAHHRHAQRSPAFPETPDRCGCHSRYAIQCRQIVNLHTPLLRRR